MPKLVVRQGKNVGFSYAFDDSIAQIGLGRRSANELQVLDEKASRNHCVIVRRAGAYYIRDLKSRNGTRVNGDMLTTDREFEFGDIIAIGDTEIEFRDDADDEPVEVEIPGYQVIERIGRGSMGDVYRARQVSMDRTVALKVLNERYNQNKDFIDRFIREARSAGRLNHPNVIHVHDVAEANGRHYFSMEYVDGRTVKALLKKERKIAYKRALDITLQAARALEYAHGNEIIHRDVKPDNIMLTKDGVVKISDLGIAKTFEEGADEGGKKKVFGTPHYMAPEQALGKPIDHRVDIYALGATLYHMITGETPFKGNTPGEVIKAHVQDSLPAIQEVNPEVPDPVVFVVEHMMAKRPEKRYPDMAKLIEDVQKLQRDMDSAEIERLPIEESTVMRAVAAKVQARRDAIQRERRPRPVRRSNPIVTAAIIVGVLGVMGIVFYFVQDFAQSVQKNGGRKPPTSAQNAGGNGGTGAVQPGASTGLTPEQAFKQVQQFESTSGDVDAIISEYERFVVRHPGSPQAGRAQQRAQELKEKREQIRAQMAKKRMAEAERFEQRNPTDFAQQLERYRKVAIAYSETPEAARARVRSKQIEKKLSTHKQSEQKRDFDEVAQQVYGLKATKEFDKAIDRIRNFIAQHSDSPYVTQAKQELRQTESDGELLWNKTQNRAKALLAERAYGRALQEITHFNKTVHYGKINQRAKAMLKGIDTQARAEFEKDAAEPNGFVATFQFGEALRGYQSLERKFRGTNWGRFATARVGSVKLQRKFHTQLKARINEPRAELLRIPDAIVPARLRKQHVYVGGADERQILFKYSRFNREPYNLEHPMPWGKMKPDQYYKLALLYFPKKARPTVEIMEMLAEVAQERGLVDEADYWFAELEK